MTIKEEILKPVVQSPAFPELLDKLNVYWQEEQKRRQAFYPNGHPAQPCGLRFRPARPRYFR